MFTLLRLALADIACVFDWATKWLFLSLFVGFIADIKVIVVSE